MSVNRSLSALNLYDVLTDLIPGVTFVGALAFLIRVEDIETLDAGLLITVTAVGGYVVGHAIQSIRSEVWGTPDLFQRTVSALHDGAGETPLGEVSDVESQFLERCREQFDLEAGFQNWSQLFRLVMSYLETQSEQRALRFQALHSFYWSMAAAFGGIALLTIGAAVANVAVEVDLLRSISTLVGVFVVSSLLAAVFEHRRRGFQKHFVRYIITDIFLATSRDD